MKFIESRAELRMIYPEPSEGVIRKELRQLDPHSRNFLARCPFVVIGSQNRAGEADVTPKGDKPGFVRVLDDTTIAIPDRPGNNRLDTFENVLENPAIGLIFMIPGMDETLRIYGEARLTADADLCAQMGIGDRPALAVLVVKIRGLYMHCAKAFIRSFLWKPETWPPRGDMPTLGEIVRDQMALAESSQEIDAYLAEDARTGLW